MPEELNWKCRLFMTMEDPSFSLTARLVSAFINACLFLSIVAFSLGTMFEFKHFPYYCPSHMIVGFTCWDGFGMPTRVMPVNVYDRSTYEAGRQMYNEYLEEKKKKEAAEAAAAAGVTPAADAAPAGPGVAPAAAGASPFDVAPAAYAEPSWMDEVAPVTENPGLYNLRGLVQSEEERVHRRLYPKKVRPIGVPYCEEICEYEPDKEIEIAEGFAMATFTVDYLTRLATAHAVPYRVINPSANLSYEPGGLFKTVRYFFTFIMLVDFFALFPYYLKTILERLERDLASSAMIRTLGLIRVTRVLPFYMHMVVSTKGVFSQGDSPHFMRLFEMGVLFRFLRLGDYAEGAPLFFSTLKASLPAIGLALIAMLCLAMMFGTAIFFAEHGTFRVTPEFPTGAFLTRGRDGTLVEPAHANIFMSMWYVISDTTPMPTVIMLVPKTTAGEVLDVVMDYMSLIVLTLPIAIFARNFHEQYNKFFKNWEEERGDIDWSSDNEEEDEDDEKEMKGEQWTKGAEMDDFDKAIAKLEAAQQEQREKLQQMEGLKSRKARQRFGFEEESKFGDFGV